MTTLRSEAEIVTFRKLAQELAQGRKERATSVHLLAALAARPGAARELLRERRLDDEALLKAGRSFDETAPDAIARAITSARELAKRSTGAAPGGLHVLLALLADRRSAAHRALEIAGVDLARLRGAAMQQAIGAIATRRVLRWRRRSARPAAPRASAARPPRQRAPPPGSSPPRPRSPATVATRPPLRTPRRSPSRSFRSRHGGRATKVAPRS
ncbi:MAG: Clp protease N-terminal domain-containing protein [Polyangiaceae bacterium]